MKASRWLVLLGISAGTVAGAPAIGQAPQPVCKHATRSALACVGVPATNIHKALTVLRMLAQQATNALRLQGKTANKPDQRMREQLPVFLRECRTGHIDHQRTERHASPAPDE